MGLSQSTQIAYIFSFVVVKKSFVNSTDTHISLSHTVHNREIGVFVKESLGGWYTGLCPRYGSLFHVSILPGIQVRAYH